MRLCREWNENGATSHEFLRKIDFVENGTTFHEFLRKKKDILAKRVQPLMSFHGKKKDYMENGEISYELLMKGQNLVTKLIVTLGYNLIQYLFIRGEFWQIYH